jgi:Terminase large subunit, T4likevirus-type, N-terminal
MGEERRSIMLDAALKDRNLLGAALGSPATWQTWFVALKAAFGIELSRQELRTFASIAGSRKPPAERVKELWALAGRGSGKSRIAAVIATYLACFQEHDLDAGEIGYVLVLAASRDQANIVFNYAYSFLRKSAILRKLIRKANAFEIHLTNRVVISIHSNSFRNIRGKTLLACIFDEVAFWRDELSANPDLETYRAVKPSLARTVGVLIGISSPYRRAGLLYAKFRDHFDKDDDDVLVVKGGTSQFNPTISQISLELRPEVLRLHRRQRRSQRRVHVLRRTLRRQEGRGEFCL